MLYALQLSVGPPKYKPFDLEWTFLMTDYGVVCIAGSGWTSGIKKLLRW